MPDSKFEKIIAFTTVTLMCGLVILALVESIIL